MKFQRKLKRTNGGKGYNYGIASCSHANEIRPIGPEQCVRLAFAVNSFLSVKGEKQLTAITILFIHAHDVTHLGTAWKEKNGFISTKKREIVRRRDLNGAESSEERLGSESVVPCGTRRAQERRKG